MDLAQLMNEAITFEHEGQKYQLQELNIESMAKFTLWLKQRALLVVDQLYHGREDDPRYKEDRKNIIDAAACGQYDWGSKNSLEAVQTPHGAAKALELSIFQSGGLITYEEALNLILNQTKKIAPLMQDVVKNPKKYSGLVDSLTGKMFSKSYPPNPSKSRKRKSKRSR